MSVQRIRWQIRGAATALLLLSAVLLVWAVRSPAAVDDPVDSGTKKRVASKTTKLVGSPPLQEFARFWSKELRRPLFDRPSQPTQDQIDRENEGSSIDRRLAGTAADSGLRLLGMMLEEGRSLAAFTDDSGKIDWKGVGEMLELSPETRVDRIELTEVTISEEGRVSVLRLPELEAP